MWNQTIVRELAVVLVIKLGESHIGTTTKNINLNSKGVQDGYRVGR